MPQHTKTKTTIYYEVTQLRESCLERFALFCDFEIDVRVLLTLHTPPGR